MSLTRVPDPQRRCPARMTLPPQADGVQLQCQLADDAHHLHRARDPDGVLRVWPRTGPGALAAVPAPPSI